LVPDHWPRPRWRSFTLAAVKNEAEIIRISTFLGVQKT
jgi:hypothetical protein